MPNEKKIVICLTLLVSYISLSASADYFYDQGFSSADYRTDFNSKTEGIGSNQLTYDDATPNTPNSCEFPLEFCGYKPLIASGSDQYWYDSSSSVWNTGASFWVLSVNNEPAFENENTGIEGLPNQVHPLYSNLDPLFMYTPAAFAVVTDTAEGENFPRANLIVRHVTSNHSLDPNGYGGIPFMGIGAQKGRGHGNDIGALRSTTRPDTVKFKARIWDYSEPTLLNEDTDGVLAFFVYAITEWEGKKRGVFVTLSHMGDGSDQSLNIYDGTSFPWNWPIEESFFHPGVDFAFIDSEDFGGDYIPYPYDPKRCHISSLYVPQMTYTDVDYQFTINWTEMFRCASARGLFETTMPASGVLPILGVHWAVEMTGANGWLWATIHDMKMQ